MNKITWTLTINGHETLTDEQYNSLMNAISEQIEVYNDRDGIYDLETFTEEEE